MTEMNGGMPIQAVENARDHYKQMFEQSCQAVSELCELAGVSPDAMRDLWTLRDAVAHLKSENKRLLALVDVLKPGDRVHYDGQPLTTGTIDDTQLIAWVKWDARPHRADEHSAACLVKVPQVPQ